MTEDELIQALHPLWQKDAACAEHPMATFFPAINGRVEASRRVERAIAICMGCMVREECLEFALETRQEFGVWGGKSERERRKIRKARHDGVEVEWRQRGNNGKFLPKPIPCGTDRGYQRHWRNSEDPCLPCTVAHADYEAGRNALRKEQRMEQRGDVA